MTQATSCCTLRAGQGGGIQVRAKLGQHLKSNVVAYLALFMATSGTAYAAGTIGSRDVINNSLKGVDVKNQTLTGDDVDEAKLRVSTVAVRARGTSTQGT